MILVVVNPHVKSDTAETWPEGTDLRYPPLFNLKKNRLREYIPLLGKFIPEITNFSNFCGVSPHFKTKNSEIWNECTDPGHPPRP